MASFPAPGDQKAGKGAGEEAGNETGNETGIETGNECREVQECCHQTLFGSKRLPYMVLRGYMVHILHIHSIARDIPHKGNFGVSTSTTSKPDHADTECFSNLLWF